LTDIPPKKDRIFQEIKNGKVGLLRQGPLSFFGGEDIVGREASLKHQLGLLSGAQVGGEAGVSLLTHLLLGYSWPSLRDRFSCAAEFSGREGGDAGRDSAPYPFCVRAWITGQIDKRREEKKRSLLPSWSTNWF